MVSHLSGQYPVTISVLCISLKPPWSNINPYNSVKWSLILYENLYSRWWGPNWLIPLILTFPLYYQRLINGLTLNQSSQLSKPNFSWAELVIFQIMKTKQDVERDMSSLICYSQFPQQLFVIFTFSFFICLMYHQMN